MFQLRWIWKNMQGKRRFFVMGLILSVTTMSMMIIIPKLSQVLVDDVLKGGQTDKMFPVLLAMCGVQLLRTTLRYLMIICLEISSQHMIIRIRNHIFDNLVHQEIRFFDRNRTGDLITRVTGDIEYVRHTCAWIVYQFTDSVSVFVASIAFLATINLGLTLLMLSITPLIAVLSWRYIKRIRPIYAHLREKLSQLNTVAQENIAGYRVVRAFVREDYEIEKFSERSEQFRKANLTASYKWQFFSFVTNIISQSLTVIMILAGGLFIINGTLTYGELTAFSGLTWALSNPMRNFGVILNDLERFFASAEKVIEVYYAKPTIADRHDAVNISGNIKGKIEFKNVSFSYKKGQIVLDNVSFTIEPGETVAIMGPTGSGKTTIVNLLARLYDVDKGEILIDGINIRMYKLSTLRKSIGIAMQDVFLFSDTIDGNIAYGDPDMPEEDVFKYAQMAAADQFIRKMEESYNTIVGERGVGLSGGQRQRISLARALAVKPPILILDDTTSAVDMETEKYIQHQLNNNIDFDCTKIIIAQRISSVKNADKIMILENGKLDIGNHESLMRRNKYYREICELQNVPELEKVAFEA